MNLTGTPLHQTIVNHFTKKMIFSEGEKGVMDIPIKSFHQGKYIIKVFKDDKKVGNIFLNVAWGWNSSTHISQPTIAPNMKNGQQFIYSTAPATQDFTDARITFVDTLDGEYTFDITEIELDDFE